MDVWCGINVIYNTFGRNYKARIYKTYTFNLYLYRGSVKNTIAMGSNPMNKEKQKRKTKKKKRKHTVKITIHTQEDFLIENIIISFFLMKKDIRKHIVITTFLGFHERGICQLSFGRVDVSILISVGMDDSNSVALYRKRYQVWFQVHQRWLFLL